MYARVAKSDERLLVIRIQRIAARDLRDLFIPLCVMICAVIIASVLPVMLGFAGVSIMLIVLLLFLMTLVLIIFVIRLLIRLLVKPKLPYLWREVICPKEVVFDRTLRKIEISGKEEKSLSFDHIQGIRCGRFSSSQSHGAKGLRRNNYFLGLELSSDTGILIATGDEEEARQLSANISRAMGRRVTRWNPGKNAG